MNSPGSAARAPAAYRSDMISETIYEEAWQEISTESSPVYERGARKTLARTSSMTRPSASETVPNLMVYPSASEMEPVLHATTWSAMEKAFEPLTLITEMAPVPGTVAGAQIVSSFLIYMPLSFIVAKIQLNLRKSVKFYYLRKVLLMGNNMCKQAASGTYLNVNALPVNAQPCFFPLTITVGHFLL